MKRKRGGMKPLTPYEREDAERYEQAQTQTQKKEKEMNNVTVNTKTIKDAIERDFKGIVKSMTDECILRDYEDETCFNFSHQVDIDDDIFCIIEGNGCIGGCWCESGDGYISPVSTYLRYGTGSIEDITIKLYNEELVDGIDIDESITNEIYHRLDDEVYDYMRTYQ